MTNRNAVFNRQKKFVEVMEQKLLFKVYKLKTYIINPNSGRMK